MARPNVGNITARANVCTCNCGRDGLCNDCDCIQTNEIGRRNDVTGFRIVTETNNNFNRS